MGTNASEHVERFQSLPQHCSGGSSFENARTRLSCQLLVSQDRLTTLILGTEKSLLRPKSHEIHVRTFKMITDSVLEMFVVCALTRGPPPALPGWI